MDVEYFVAVLIVTILFAAAMVVETQDLLSAAVDAVLKAMVNMRIVIGLGMTALMVDTPVRLGAKYVRLDMNLLPK